MHFLCSFAHSQNFYLKKIFRITVFFECHLSFKNIWALSEKISDDGNSTNSIFQQEDFFCSACAERMHRCAECICRGWHYSPAESSLIVDCLIPIIFVFLTTYIYRMFKISSLCYLLLNFMLKSLIWVSNSPQTSYKHFSRFHLITELDNY